MKKHTKIYLAGSVPKGDTEAKDFIDWRKTYARELEKIIEKVEIIDPFDRGEFDESNFLAVFGTDCRHIKNCDLVIANDEGSGFGVGAAQELVIAKYFKKPVITILPKATHHRRLNLVFRGQLIEDWIHPFVYAFSDLILEDIKALAGIDFAKIKIKDISIIDHSIDALSL